MRGTALAITAVRAADLKRVWDGAGGGGGEGRGRRRKERGVDEKDRKYEIIIIRVESS